MDIRVYILLFGLINFASCVHEPVEPNPSKVTGLPLYRNPIPVSKIEEPGCKPQMETDQMGYHKNVPRDSLYIRDLIVNPNNDKQWVIAEHHIEQTSDWELLWFIDLEARQKRKLDSSYLWGYGSLTYGGEYVGYALGYDGYVQNIKNGVQKDLGKSTYLSLSPNGEYFINANNGLHLHNTDAQLIEHTWRDSVAFVCWLSNSKAFLTEEIFHNPIESSLFKVSIDDYKIEELHNTNRSFGVNIECFSLDSNSLYFSGHRIVNLHNFTQRVYIHYCERQHFEKIIPLPSTNEYLGLKFYKETVDYYTTHNFYKFHVFEEGGVNERRVTLNFDKLKIVE